MQCLCSEVRSVTAHINNSHPELDNQTNVGLSSENKRNKGGTRENYFYSCKTPLFLFLVNFMTVWLLPVSWIFIYFFVIHLFHHV